MIVYCRNNKSVRLCVLCVLSKKKILFVFFSDFRLIFQTLCLYIYIYIFFNRLKTCIVRLQCMLYVYSVLYDFFEKTNRLLQQQLSKRKDIKDIV